MSATVSTAAAQDYRSAIQFLDAVADNVQRDGLRVTATHPGSYRFNYIIKRETVTLRDLSADTDNGVQDHTLPVSMESVITLYTQAKMALEAEAEDA